MELRDSFQIFFIDITWRVVLVHHIAIMVDEDKIAQLHLIIISVLRLLHHSFTLAHNFYEDVVNVTLPFSNESKPLVVVDKNIKS
jgi:hypothetical protein